MFATIHVKPMDIEERRRQMADPFKVNKDSDSPYDIIMGFFETYFEDHDESDFMLFLSSTLLLPLHEFINKCPQDVYATIPEQTEWKPPCENYGKCTSTICTGVCIKFSILLHAMFIVKKMRALYPTDITATNESDIINHLYAFIDSHMPLIAAATSTYVDGKTQAEKWISAYHICPPDLQYAYTRHVLPDVSVLMPLSLLYNNVPESNKRMLKRKFPVANEHNLSVLSSIVNLLYKLVPHRCNMREPHQSMNNACIKNNSMADFICKLLIASWLGVYRSSYTKMPLGCRVVLYSMFYKGMPLSEVLEIFTVTNTTMLMYVAKEYYCDLTEKLPGFKRAMVESYDWKMYYQYMVQVTEVVRKRVIANLKEKNSFGGPNCIDDLFDGIGSTIVHLHESYRHYQRSNSVNYNIEVILKTCVDINYKMYTVNPNDCNIVPGKELYLPSPHLTIAKDKEDVMRRIVNLYHRDRSVPMDWLIFFGVTVREIASMKIAVFSIMPNLRRELERMTADVYAIFYTFFKLCNDRGAYYEIPGSAIMYCYHAAALINKHRVKDGEPIPPIVGCLQACDNCGDVKHPSFFPRDTKNKHSDGKGNVMIRGSGVAVCACRPQKTTWRELHFAKHGEHTQSKEKNRPIRWTDQTVMRKFAKRVANKLLYSKCQRTPTRTLCSLTKFIVYGGVIYTCCYLCLRAMPLEKLRYYEDKILCPQCRSTREIEVQMELAQARQATGGWEGADEEKCEYCGKVHIKGVEQGFTRKFYLYDDSDTGNRFRDMYFCTNHSPLHWVKSHNYTRRSKVIQGISEKWETLTPSGDIIPCN